MATSIIKYTSPSIPFTLDIDLTDAQILATFKQEENVVVTKRASNVSIQNGKTSFSIKLEQAETAKFDESKQVEIQVNWIYINDNRGASEPKLFPVLKNLLDEVIDYGY